MKYITAKAVLFCLVLLSAGLHATAARQLPPTSQRRLAQLQYVPQGCQGLQFAVTSYHSFSWQATPIVYGKVVISNPNNFAIPLSNVKVQVSNDATVAPIFQDANCGAMSVPPANEFGWAGTITCTYRVNLPNSGLAAGISHWPSVMATATINMSNAKCSSAVTQISTSFWARLAQGLFNTFEPSTAGTTPQGLTATAGATNAGRRLSQATPAQVQQGQLGYVPTGCQGLTVTTNANQQQPNIVSGTVVLTNPGTIDIPIATVDVLLGNNIGMPPLHTTTCVGAVVPANPQPYTVGELVCTFSFTLPNNGPWIGVPQTPTWTIAKATATIAMSDAKCSSPVVTVMGTEPPVLGH